MMNDDITTVIEYLESSVQNNEVTNVDKLTLAIGELENFPMTFDILDSSRVGQILQSIRHSKQITIFISERIRSLIKCWRQLLNAEVCSVTPSQQKSLLSKTPAAKNGYTNGYTRDPQVTENEAPLNGLNHSTSKTDEPAESNFKYKRKITDKEISEVVKENVTELEADREKEPENQETRTRIRSISSSSKADENSLSTKESHNISNSQIGKPKVKSTKELLADFSNFIENDTKNKILMDKISQEVDEPMSYFPQDFKMKELIQLSILQEEKNRSRTKIDKVGLKRKRLESLSSIDEKDDTPKISNCQLLAQQFQQKWAFQPQLTLNQFVPWPNLKRGLDLHPPEIRQPRQKRPKNPDQLIAENNSLSIDVINDLLETFEVRAQKKQMISEAIQQRKEQTTLIDNTESFEEMSMKLKLKIPKVPILKILRKKIRKKKKKKKKKVKPKIVIPKVKKPRKPRIRPMPPVTNYLDDIPTLPPLPADGYVPSTADRDSRPLVEFSDENIKKLAFGVLEGYNRTRSSQHSQMFELTSMYSNVIDQQYLHIFPWVDLFYPSRSTFPIDSDQLLQSMTTIPNFYS